MVSHFERTGIPVLAGTVIGDEFRFVSLWTITGAPVGVRFLDWTVTGRDSKPGSGESYYYVRIQQRDRNLAWSSPIWVDYR